VIGDCHLFKKYLQWKPNFVYFFLKNNWEMGAKQHLANKFAHLWDPDRDVNEMYDAETKIS